MIDNKQPIDRIREYYVHIKAADSAWRTWDDCARHFIARRRDHNQSALVLDHYLATWGMRRGAAPLARKNWRVHREAIEIMDSYHDHLWHLCLTPDEIQLERLFELYATLTTFYRDAFGKPSYSAETLITKILLGRFGCVPAYDRFFKEGLTGVIELKSFSRQGFSQLLTYCGRLQDDFYEAQDWFNSLHNQPYPIMKIIDMHYFARGQEYTKT